MARAADHHSYKTSDNTYTLNRVNGKDHEPMIEVGNRKDSGLFVPHLKLSKWGDESHIALASPEGWMGSGDFLSHQGESLVWSRGIYQTKFYDLGKTNSEDGSFEYEMILLAPPETNKITVPLERKNIKMVYQPLKIEDYGPGAECQDHILGSYAVFHSHRRNNEYKTGLIGYIHRPFAKDAVGHTTWCTLNEDAELIGKLIITIPENFLATAVYPVSIDPDIGITSLGATGYYNTSSTTYDHTVLINNSDTPTSDGNLTYGYVGTYLSSASPTFQTMSTVYVDTTPLTSAILIEESNAVETTGPVTGDPTAGSFKQHTLSASISNGTNYSPGGIRTPASGATSARICATYNNNNQAGLSEASFAAPANLGGYSTNATLADRQISVYFTWEPAASTRRIFIIS